MPWPTTELVKSRCRHYLSRVYLRFMQFTVGTGLEPLFDRQFYLDRYPDVAPTGIDPVAHFMRYGARESRQPHPMFDTAYYLAANPDVAAAGLNPLLQFLRKGWKEGRRPNPLFDPNWYAARYGLAEDVNPLLDYARRRAANEDVLPRPSLREFLLEPAPALDGPVPAGPTPTGDTGCGTARMYPAVFHHFAASAARLRRSGKPVILAISHSFGGGVAEHLRQLSGTLVGQAEFLLLTPSGNVVILESLNPDYEFSLAIDPTDDYEGLLEALRQCAVARLHIQHLKGHVLDVERLRADLGVPFDFTVHDYFTICPQVHLNRTNGRYCGEPDEAGCNRCLAERPVYPPRLIDQWRRDHAWLLHEAARVIAPSLDTAQRMERHSPGLPIVAAAHPDAGGPAPQRNAPPLGAREPLRIVVLGVLSRNKGLALVTECARIARRRGLPLGFTLIGHVDQTAALVPQPFRQTGQYDNSDLPALLARVNPHLVWFPSQVPETHSFTLSAALHAGLPVVVPALGAMPERVSGLDWAWVIPPDWDAKRTIAFFLGLRENNVLPRLAPLPPRGPSPAPHGFYETEYLHPAKIHARDSRP